MNHRLTACRAAAAINQQLLSTVARQFDAADVEQDEREPVPVAGNGLIPTVHRDRSASAAAREDAAHGLLLASKYKPAATAVVAAAGTDSANHTPSASAPVAAAGPDKSELPPASSAAAARAGAVAQASSQRDVEYGEKLLASAGISTSDLQGTAAAVAHTVKVNAVPPPTDAELTLHSTARHFEQVKALLVRLALEWSEEGSQQRVMCYQPIVAELLACTPSAEHAPRVLMPGAGLARLAFELALAGYDVHANEESYFNIVLANYVLNKMPKRRVAKVHPWIADNANHVRPGDQLRAAAVPDVCAATKLAALQASAQGDALPAGQISLVAGSFGDNYSDPEQSGTFDASVTCFSLDTAPVALEMAEHIHRLLRVGGHWVNFGPLAFPWQRPPADDHVAAADDRYARSVEFTYYELRHALHAMGFKMVAESVHNVTYGSNPMSLQQVVHSAIQFTAVKMPTPPLYKLIPGLDCAKPVNLSLPRPKFAVQPGSRPARKAGPGFSAEAASAPVGTALLAAFAMDDPGNATPRPSSAVYGMSVTSTHGHALDTPPAWAERGHEAAQSPSHLLALSPGSTLQSPFVSPMVASLRCGFPVSGAQAFTPGLPSSAAGPGARGSVQRRTPRQHPDGTPFTVPSRHQGAPSPDREGGVAMQGARAAAPQAPGVKRRRGGLPPRPDHGNATAAAHAGAGSRPARHVRSARLASEHAGGERTPVGSVDLEHEAARERELAAPSPQGV